MPHVATERAGNIGATTCKRQPQPQIKISFEKQLANAYIVTKWQQRHALPFQLKRCGDTLHLGSKKAVGFNTCLNLRATV